MALQIPPLEIRNLLESKPVKSRLLVRELTVTEIGDVRVQGRGAEGFQGPTVGGISS